jgi:hypothetical protein
MYNSYIEIEYIATSFSPARMDLALKLLSVVGGLKMESGASSVSGGNTLERTLCVEIIRFKLGLQMKYCGACFFVMIWPWEQFQGKD